MRRFLVTNPKYNGQAELVYNDRETLCMIDCTKTDMGEEIIKHFKQAVPVTIAGLQGGRSFSADTVIVESDFVVSFKRFYDEYPLKRNRFRAEKLFEKLNGSQQVTAYYSLSGYKKYLTKYQSFAMGADRYLSERHYETEWRKL